MRTPGPVAQTLAEWAGAARIDDVDEVVLARVKMHILDQIGAQVSCQGLDAPRVTQQYAKECGVPGNASVLGTDLSFDAEYAGLVNGTAGSSFEIDDYGGNGTYAHPGCVVVPGALAVGEEVGASGADVLLASTLGFEMVIRLARASTPSLLLDRGFHQTGAHGVFAVALVASRLYGLDITTTTHALAIAGSHASGTTEYARAGGEVKRLHAGVGVAAGIRSARLAQLGLTGPPTIFEGRRGFLQAFCDEYDASFLSDDLGQRWYFAEHAAIKPYACCGLVHHHFAAYDKIAATYEVDHSEIREIVMGCEPLTISHTGNIGPHPADMVEAQFSAEYSLAMRVVNGRNDVSAYREAEALNFQDPDVTALAERVRLELDPECSSGTPMGRVTLNLVDGKALSATGFALGSPNNPMSAADIEDKYRGLVTPDFGRSVAEESLDIVRNLEDLADLRELTGLFAAPLMGRAAQGD